MQLYLFTSMQGQINHIAEIVNSEYTDGELVDDEIVRIIDTAVSPSVILEDYFFDININAIMAFPAKPNPTAIWDWSTRTWVYTTPTPVLSNISYQTSLHTYEITFDLTDSVYPQSFFGVELWESTTPGRNSASLMGTLTGTSVRRDFGQTVTRYVWLRPVWTGGGAGEYSAGMLISTKKIFTDDLAHGSLSTTTPEAVNSLAAIPDTDGLICTYSLQSPTISTGMLNCQFISEIRLLDVNTVTNLIELRVDAFVDNVKIASSSSAYLTLPAVDILQTSTPVASLYNFMSTYVPKDEIITFKVFGNCSAANKLQLATFHVYPTLLKR